MFFCPVFCGVFLFRTSIPKDSQLSFSRSCTEQRSRVLKMAVSSPAVLHVIRTPRDGGPAIPGTTPFVALIPPTPTEKPSNLEFKETCCPFSKWIPPNRIYVGKKNPSALTTKKTKAHWAEGVQWGPVPKFLRMKSPMLCCAAPKIVKTPEIA